MKTKKTFNMIRICVIKCHFRACLYCQLCCIQCIHTTCFKLLTLRTMTLPLFFANLNLLLILQTWPTARNNHTCFVLLIIFTDYQTAPKKIYNSTDATQIPQFNIPILLICDHNALYMPGIRRSTYSY